jgi:hypothetical protein
MTMQLIVGRKGRLKASKREFEITVAGLRMAVATFAWMLCLGANRAFAVCTQHGTVTSSSTAIVGSNDLAPAVAQGRHYFLIQNTGTTNPMNVAIGSSNAATSSDMYLGPGASWVMGPIMSSAAVPGGDVSAISANGTTYSFCDF